MRPGHATSDFRLTPGVLSSLRYTDASPMPTSRPGCRASRLSPALVVGGRPVAGGSRYAARSRLTDEEFWQLSQDLSEPNGYFRSDNLLSNEFYYPEILPPLLRQAKTGGVYLGVGPEQNFNYIVAIRPKMVFITDVRRGNLHTQLMYKALFEMSSDRADFFGRLFTKKRPDGLDRRLDGRRHRRRATGIRPPSPRARPSTSRTFRRSRTT